jgi:hypothetical protein
MSAIFTTQGFLVIVLDTGIDLSTASNLKILYKKPSGVKGEFTATVFETTKLRYQFDNDNLDIPGQWSFQAFVTIGGLNAYGEIVRQKIDRTLL